MDKNLRKNGEMKKIMDYLMKANQEGAGIVSWKLTAKSIIAYDYLGKKKIIPLKEVL